MSYMFLKTALKILSISVENMHERHKWVDKHHYFEIHALVMKKYTEYSFNM